MFEQTVHLGQKWLLLLSVVFVPRDSKRDGLLKGKGIGDSEQNGMN